MKILFFFLEINTMVLDEQKLTIEICQQNF
jgi:hypothetical protein